MQIFSHARVSTHNESKLASPIPYQVRHRRDSARIHGWSVSAEFTDDIISGAAMGNRPGLKRALAALGAATGRLLLVADLSPSAVLCQTQTTQDPQSAGMNSNRQHDLLDDSNASARVIQARIDSLVDFHTTQVRKRACPFRPPLRCAR
jgi:hypothetical protein